MPGGDLFTHFFFASGSLADVRAFRRYCKAHPTRQAWHAFVATAVWTTFAARLRTTYFGRFLAYVTITVRGVSQKNSRLSTVWSQVFTHLGMANGGLDVNHQLGMAAASRRVRENTVSICMGYDLKVGGFYEDDHVFASWLDNYAHHYYAAVIRVNRSYMHCHDGHVRGLLRGRVRDMALPRKADGTVIPAFSHGWFSTTNRLRVAAQVNADLRGGRATLWLDYYDTSFCKTDAIGTCPPRPGSHYTIENSTFHAEGMYEERVSTTAGYIAALAKLKQKHEPVWNRGRATIAVVDVDLYSGTITMSPAASASSDWDPTQHSSLVRGTPARSCATQSSSATFSLSWGLRCAPFTPTQICTRA
jgi:hypothetical protein